MVAQRYAMHGVSTLSPQTFIVSMTSLTRCFVRKGSEHLLIGRKTAWALVRFGDVGLKRKAGASLPLRKNCIDKKMTVLV